jgi:hypothetical protein
MNQRRTTRYVQKKKESLCASFCVSEAPDNLENDLEIYYVNLKTKLTRIQRRGSEIMNFGILTCWTAKICVNLIDGAS